MTLDRLGHADLNVLRWCVLVLDTIMEAAGQPEQGRFDAGHGHVKDALRTAIMPADLKLDADGLRSARALVASYTAVAAMLPLLEPGWLEGQGTPPSAIELKATYERLDRLAERASRGQV